MCVGAHLFGSAILNLGEGLGRARECVCVRERAHVCHDRVLKSVLGCVLACVLRREICVKVVPTEPFCFVVSPPSLLDDQAADLNTSPPPLSRLPTLHTHIPLFIRGVRTSLYQIGCFAIQSSNKREEESRDTAAEAQVPCVVPHASFHARPFVRDEG